MITLKQLQETSEFLPTPTEIQARLIYKLQRLTEDSSPALADYILTNYRKISKDLRILCGTYREVSDMKTVEVEMEGFNWLVLFDKNSDSLASIYWCKRDIFNSPIYRIDYFKQSEGLPSELDYFTKGAKEIYSRLYSLTKTERDATK